jgi:hypothetical protein
MIHQIPTTELEDHKDSILPDIATALATTTQWLGKPHNTLVMGRAAFMRVPVSEANDLNYLLNSFYFDSFLNCSYWSIKYSYVLLFLFFFSIKIGDFCALDLTPQKDTNK